jgi:hypothetical protein
MAVLNLTLANRLRRPAGHATSFEFRCAPRLESVGNP